jgi:sensor histidine kinase YesM
MLGLKSNVKPITNFIYIAIIVIILSLVYKYNLTFVLIALNIALRIIYTRLFNGSLKSKIFYVVIFYIFVVLGEIIGIILVCLLFKVDMQQISNVEYLNIIAVVISEMIMLILIIMMCNIKGFKNINMPTKYWALLLSTPIMGLTIFLVIDFYIDIDVENYKYQILFCIITASTIYNYILIGILFNKLSTVFKNRNFNNLLDQQKNYQLKFYENMRVSDKEIKNVRHDLNNHLQCIYDLLMTDRFDEAKNYIETVSNTVQINNRLINTGNAVFDSILNAKISIIKNAGINFNYSIEIPSGIKIDPMDVCIILGNSIDNAIEACSRIKDGPRQISLIAAYHNKGLILSIRNTVYSGSLVKKGDVYLSSKDNPSEHGIGISNISRTAEKYNGIVVINNAADIFELSAALYNV